MLSAPLTAPCPRRDTAMHMRRRQRLTCLDIAVGNSFLAVATPKAALEPTFFDTRLSAMKQVVQWLFLSVALAVTLILSGCFIPEEFDARIDIHQDGSYSLTYDGTLTFVPAILAMSQGKAPTTQDEAELQKISSEMRKDPGIKKSEYLGKGRYKVTFVHQEKAGQAYYFLSREWQIFSIRPQADGKIEMRSSRPDVKALEEPKTAGAKVDGTLQISVAFGVQVLEQNADSTPWLYGLWGAYSWRIKSPGANPLMIVQVGH